jgi:hypothetical protein
MTNSSAPYDANGNDKECFMIDVNINILPLVEGVTVDYHKKKKYNINQILKM